MNFWDLSHTAQQNGRTMGRGGSCLLLTVPHVLPLSRTVWNLGKNKSETTEQKLSLPQSASFTARLSLHKQNMVLRKPLVWPLKSPPPNFLLHFSPLCTSILWETPTLLWGQIEVIAARIFRRQLNIARRLWWAPLDQTVSPTEGGRCCTPGLGRSQALSRLIFPLATALTGLVSLVLSVAKCFWERSRQ